MLLSQGIIVSKPLSSLSPNKTAEYHIETLVFQTHCFERVGVQWPWGAQQTTLEKQTNVDNVTT